FVKIIERDDAFERVEPLKLVVVCDDLLHWHTSLNRYNFCVRANSLTRLNTEKLEYFVQYIIILRDCADKCHRQSNCLTLRLNRRPWIQIVKATPCLSSLSHRVGLRVGYGSPNIYA